MTIRRSKTDQEGQGAEIAILRGCGLRPVEAVQMWFAAAVPARAEGRACAGSAAERLLSRGYRAALGSPATGAGEASRCVRQALK